MKKNVPARYSALLGGWVGVSPLSTHGAVSNSWLSLVQVDNFRLLKQLLVCALMGNVTGMQQVGQQP